MRFLSFFTAAVLLGALPLLAQVDTSFGVQGRVVMRIDAINRAADLVAGEGDTLRVLAWCGHSDSLHFDADCVVAMLDPLGAPVPDFGIAGISRFDFFGMDYSTARSLAMLEDGRLLVLGAGSTFAEPGISPLCVARLLHDGSPDPSFGVGGTAKVHFYGGQEFPGALGTTSDKVFLAGGSWDTLGAHNVPVVGNYSAEMICDSTFGGTGELVIDFAAGLTSVRLGGPAADSSEHVTHLTGGEAYALLPLEDGSVLVGGSYGAQAFLTRLTPAGQLDSSFGESGHLLFQMEPFFNNWVQDVLELPDGSMLVGINSDRPTGRNYYLMRIAAGDGSLLDNSEVDVLEGNDELTELVLLPEGGVACLGSRKGYLSADLRQMSLVHLPLLSDLSQQQPAVWEVDSSHSCAPAAISMLGMNRALLLGSLDNDAGSSDIALLCLNSSTFTIGVAEPPMPAPITLWPNPCNGNAWVSIPPSQTSHRMELWDLQGKMLEQTPLGLETEWHLKMADHVSGLYLVIVKDSEGAVLGTRRLVRN